MRQQTQVPSVSAKNAIIGENEVGSRVLHGGCRPSFLVDKFDCNRVFFIQLEQGQGGGWNGICRNSVYKQPWLWHLLLSPA